MSRAYRAEPVLDAGELCDVRVHADGRSLPLAGKGGPGAEREAARAAVKRSRCLPVFLCSGLGAGIAALLGQGLPVAVVDREGPILAVTRARERFGKRTDVLWLDDPDPAGVLRALTRWQLKHDGKKLVPIVSPLYLRLDREFYGPLHAELERLQSHGFFARMRYAKFRGPLPRVLVLGSRYFLMGEVLNALTRLGAPFCLIDLQQSLADKDGHSRAILAAAAEFKPDFLLTLNHLGFDRSGGLASLLAQVELPAASWFADDPTLNLFLFEHARSPWVAIFCCDADSVGLLRADGFPQAHYLPLATDATIFRPGALGWPQWRAKVSFVGDSKAGFVAERFKAVKFPRELLRVYRSVARGFRIAPERTPADYIRRALPDLAETLDRMKDQDLCKWFELVVMYESSRLYRKDCLLRLLPFAPLIVGDSLWRAALKGHAGQYRLLPPLDYYEDLPGFYPLSEINLNVTSTQMKDAANQRVFDVPATGSFLLTDHCRQVEDLFEPGREVVFFRSAEDLPDLVGYFLGHAAERKSIATAARARVLAEHTYEHRLRTLFEIMRKTYA